MPGGNPIEFLLHLDQHLAEVIRAFGPGTYAILFGLVFCETGLVIMPFLPGDSLLFAAGLFSRPPDGPLSFPVLFFGFTAASIIGDSTNFWIGKKLGLRLFKKDGKLLKTEHLKKTREFYDKHGRRAIILGKFVPFARTLAPFVAGLDAMPYDKFVAVSVLASVIWVGVCVGAGHLFGSIPLVRDHFGEIVLGIIVISVGLFAFETMRGRKHKRG
jgi:membrane-associated protein